MLPDGMKCRYRKVHLQCNSRSERQLVASGRLYCGQHTDEGNIIFHVTLGGQALRVWQTSEGGDTREDRVSLLKSN